jgi:quinohemoprotein ethanol dehydrogenase
MLGISSGVLPDLRWSTYASSKDAWNNVIMNGALADNGMVAFDDVLTPEDSEAIRAYVLTQAHLNRSTEEESAPDPEDEAIGPGMSEVDPDADAGDAPEPEMEAGEDTE